MERLQEYFRLFIYSAHEARRIARHSRIYTYNIIFDRVDVQALPFRLSFVPFFFFPFHCTPLMAVPPRKQISTLSKQEMDIKQYKERRADLLDYHWNANCGSAISISAIRFKSESF